MPQVFQYPGKVEPLEPSLYVIPEMDSWFRQASEPARLIPIPTEGNAVIDFSLANWPVPGNAHWIQPARHVVQPRPPSPEGLEVKPLEPSLYIMPEMSSWYMQAQEPVRVQPETLREFLVGSLEPIAPIIIPSMATWFMQASEPVIAKPPAVEGEAFDTRFVFVYATSAGMEFEARENRMHFTARVEG